MSRNIPVYMRHKRRATPDQEVSRNVSLVGLRLAAIFYGIGCLISAVLGVRGLIEGPHTLPGVWAPAAYMAVSIGALVVGRRLWELKRWACIAAVVGAWLICLGYPWRPDLYRDAVVDVGSAIAASVMACVIIAVPLTIACIVDRSKLRPGF